MPAVLPGTGLNDDFYEPLSGGGDGGGGGGSGSGSGGGGSGGGNGVTAGGSSDGTAAAAAAATAEVHACVAVVVAAAAAAPVLATDASRSLAAALASACAAEWSPAVAGTAGTLPLIHPATGNGDYLASQSAVWSGLAAAASADGLAALATDMDMAGRLLAQSVTGGGDAGGAGGGRRRSLLPPTAGAECARRRLLVGIRAWGVTSLVADGRGWFWRRRDRLRRRRWRRHRRHCHRWQSVWAPSAPCSTLGS